MNKDLKYFKLPFLCSVLGCILFGCLILLVRATQIEPQDKSPKATLKAVDPRTAHDVIIQEYTYDGCQYFSTMNAHELVHKGNCSNPIHYNNR